MSQFKQYLGDSVYADYDPVAESIVLTLENGDFACDKIYLDATVLRAMDNYRAWLKAQEEPKP